MLGDEGGQLALILADRAGDVDGRSVFAVARTWFPDVRRGRLIEWGQWGDAAVREEILSLMAAGERRAERGAGIVATDMAASPGRFRDGRPPSRETLPEA